MNFNRVIFGGNMTRDPQLKYLPSQMAVAEFGIAWNHKYKTKSGEEREDVVFIDCTAWGRTAEAINEHFQKGKPILVEGRIKMDQWDDKQTGAKRSRLLINVESFQFCGGDRPSGASGDAPRGESTRARGRASRPEPADSATNAPEGTFKEDDIPF